MKWYLIIITFSMGLGLLSCTKTDTGSTDFLTTVAKPDRLNALFEITQDNSGSVTITPGGQGAAYYRIYMPEDAASFVKVSPGSSYTRSYKEGTYNVRVEGVSLSGSVAEVIKPLTVTFRQPENFEVAIVKDAANNYAVQVSATALYETFFQVYFGEAANEVPLSFNEGDVLSHTYQKVGTYTIRVVALSGGAAQRTFTQQVTITDPLVLPVNFESATLPYAFSNFDGGVATVESNPSATGINPSTRVGKMVKYAGQPWGGSVLPLSSNIDFSAGKIFAMKVWSPRVGARVLLKIENAADASKSFEKEVATTVANAWEDLYFDYSGVNTSNTYSRIVLIFDNGTMGNGSANFTFYFDDIRLVSAIPVNIALPLGFEASHPYTFTDFDGGNLSVIDNPHKTGINTSNKVARMVKNAGQPWGGSVITMTSPLDFSRKTFKAKIYSPRVGAKVLLKVENLTNGGINFEKEVLTTVANAWEELSFDYSAINTGNSYQKIVFIFDNGTMGDGSGNFTFLIDDITLN